MFDFFTKNGFPAFINTLTLSGIVFLQPQKTSDMKKGFERQEGLDKLKEMIESIHVCMFLTKNNDSIHVRPMATIKVEDNGTGFLPG